MTYDVIEAAHRKTQRMAVAAALVLLTLLAAAGAAWYGICDHGSSPTDHRPGAAAPSANDAPATPAEPSTPDTRSSAVAPHPQAVIPTDLTWVEVAGVALPVSPSVGPRETGGGRARGFAHTETGAVIAAVHLLVRTAAQVGPAIFDPTIAEQVIGPDAASMRNQVAQTYAAMCDAAQVPYGQPVGRLTAALHGFRIDSYTSTDTSLAVLTEATDSTGTQRMAATQIQLRWVADDWALVAPAGGTWDSEVLIVASEQAVGFTTLTEGR